MFEKIKAFFTSDRGPSLEERMERLGRQLDVLTAQRDDHARKATELQKELDVLKEKEREREERRNSKEPWVVLTTADFDEKKGFRIELDWNDAFIKQLKENGIEGPSDEVAIQKWLAFLYEDIVQQLDANTQQNKQEKKIVSDYQ